MEGEGEGFDVRLARTILGIIAIITGILILVFPGITINVLVALLAVGLIILGLISLIVGVRGAKRPSWQRIALPIGGIIALALGIAAIVAPGFGPAVLFVLLGVGLLFYGVSRISSEALPADKPSGHRLFHGILGVIIILLALGVIFVPSLGDAILVVVLSLALLIGGIVELSSGVQGVTPRFPT
ncbi:MAG: DUF308 domain-containing protein [Thermoplasmata archaeon]